MISALLHSEQLEMSDVVGVALWLRDLGQFAEVNKVFSARLSGTWEPPVRACLEVALPEEFPVLLEATAHRSPLQLPDVTEESEWSKQILHVQSLSHWAPASIGPYSQAVRVTIISIY